MIDLIHASEVHSAATRSQSDTGVADAIVHSMLVIHHAHDGLKHVHKTQDTLAPLRRTRGDGRSMAASGSIASRGMDPRSCMGFMRGSIARGSIERFQMVGRNVCRRGRMYIEDSY